ncbi:4'-phosphopantetheinyl transferase superfamily protein [Cronobacter turicensis]|nr:4'-phosphopantetheinyl transferase superfamily protein [Cronobacter turicensis]ELQ6075607.1 4'-phosphopantetheinyl transferase superfamily protein [Cronobacter turicensis]ELQ6232993.1 4'-phosphopantetheinyl transferase superfamily protein [Cronobacter turicensis]ELQ6238715.1 4'-phosphopantetheinyl transferase superfamily protein [Cronobacter turicensis]ELQ6253124.1 4'-phosphopantetheinyl transferase superfamily protein [Cronobacter turicensis]
MLWREVAYFKDNDGEDIIVFVGNYSDFTQDDAIFLSEDEKIMSQKFSSVSARNRYIAGKAFLRRALGFMFNKGPFQGAVLKDEYGKPYIVDFDQNINFNVSHTGNVIVIAFSKNKPLGIDIELKNRSIHQHLVGYIFTDEEAEEILSKADWPEYFLRAWTRKEAVLKCIGCGFACDAKEIKVPLSDEKLLAYKNSLNVNIFQSWHLFTIDFLPNIIGVIAI